MSSLKKFANAIEKRDSSLVQSLISRRLVDVNARLPRPSRPPALVYAAGRGQREIVDILLRAGARVDDAGEGGWTACHAAAEFGHHDVLALLLARQPNLAAVDEDGKTAFCIALMYCHNDSGRSALMLLEAGATVDEHARLCRFAATSTAAIQALLDRGVVVCELRDVFGGTPLHAAAWHCHDAAVFDVLVNVCGIDLETRDRDGTTYLDSAAGGGNVFALRWLLNAGADPNSLKSNGSTPLHDAYNRDCAVVLLAAGANVCARDNRGRTALHRLLWFEEQTRRPVARTAALHLIAAGVDLDAADNTSETARAMLARLGHRGTIDPEQVEQARRDIAKTRIDLVRYRALEVCIGLQSLRIDALQLCEILQFACGRFAPLIRFTSGGRSPPR